MRLLSFLVAIFSAVVVADSSWSWFQDNAIDDLENPYSQSAPGSLSTQSDPLLPPDQDASTDLARKNKSVFEPDCKGFEFTLCCTGVQTEDWNPMDGKFFSITDCKKYTEVTNCYPENWYCCHKFIPGIMWIIAPQGTICQGAPNKKTVVKRQPQPPFQVGSVSDPQT